MASVDTTRESALLKAAQAGDRQALEHLIELYQPLVLRFGLRMCKNFDDAQDIVQETLLAAARSLNQFQGRSSLSTWLYTIARSYCIKKRRRSKFAPREEASLDDTHNAEATRLATPERSPEQMAIDRELEGALRRAIDQLEPMYREVLVLRDMEGLTAPEVAEVVGASVPAVKSRLHRARTAVREALVPFLEPEPTPLRKNPAAECPDIVHLFSRNLEGEVSERLCHELQAHLDQCPRCQQKCDSITRVVQMCRTQPEPPVPDALKAAVREAVRALQPNRPTGSLR